MIDWFAGIFELTGAWLVGNKNRFGFVFSFICCILWIITAFLTGVYGLLIVVIPALFINIRNFRKWRVKDTKHMTNYERFYLFRGKESSNRASKGKVSN